MLSLLSKVHEGVPGEAALLSLFGSGSGPGRVTRCLGPSADSGRKKTRHNNLVRSSTEHAHVQSLSLFTTPECDDHVCWKFFQFQERTNFRSCCPWDLRVIFSVRTARNLRQPPRETTSEKASFLFSLGVRARFWVVNLRLALGLNDTGHRVNDRVQTTLNSIMDN